MLDIKAWLAITGIENEENYYFSPPSMPYILFLDNQDWRGADGINNICERSISLELYSETIDKISEQKIEDILNMSGYQFTKNRLWIADSLDAFQTTYDFSLVEKS